MNYRNKIIGFLVFSFLMLAGITCKESESDNNDKETGSKTEFNPQDELKGVETFRVSKNQFEDAGMVIGTPGMTNYNQTIRAAGYLNVPPVNRAEVRSYIGGYLGACDLVEGDYVKKGQFLISLNNLEYLQIQQEYLQSKQQLEFLKTEYIRKKTLADERIASQSSMQQAETDYNNMLVKYKTLRKKLELINIDPDRLGADNLTSGINLYSPIDGYIVSVKAVKGMFADPTDVIFEMINMDHLHVELKVFEKDVLKIKKGQKVLFRLPESNIFDLKGEIYLIGREINNPDRTVNVHCHLDDESKITAIVGTYLEAKIIIDTSTKFCLPAAAVIHESGEDFVLVNTSISSDEYVFEKVKVNVGASNEGCKEIAGKSGDFLKGKTVLIDGVDYF